MLTRRRISSRAAFDEPTMTSAPPSWSARCVATISLNAMLFTDDAVELTAAGVVVPAAGASAELPQDASTSTRTAALQAERKPLSEHLREAARADTTLRFIYRV